MKILCAENFEDYELLDTGHGARLERFGTYTLVRPDPQICWNPSLSNRIWHSANAIFKKTSADRGTWDVRGTIPERWLMRYKDLSFWAKLTPFKHTGIFPEQSIQWAWMRSKLKGKSQSAPRNVLNLFGYTGIASIACAAEGAKVTHLDASKPSVTWARDNQIASGLADKPIRWIIDDAIKFTAREIKRGVKYDGIIMDPPIYGHGPNGERWEFMSDFPKLLENCSQILSKDPLFIVVNAYAISASAIMLENVLADYFSSSGSIECGELALKETSAGRLLSTGIYARWSSQ